MNLFVNKSSYFLCQDVAEEWGAREDCETVWSRTLCLHWLANFVVNDINHEHKSASSDSHQNTIQDSRIDLASAYIVNTINACNNTKTPFANC